MQRIVSSPVITSHRAATLRLHLLKARVPWPQPQELVAAAAPMMTHLPQSAYAVSASGPADQTLLLLLMLPEPPMRARRHGL